MKSKFLILVVLVLALLCGCTPKDTGPYDVEFRGRSYTVDLSKGIILQGEDTYTFTRDGEDYQLTYPNGATYHCTKQGIGSVSGWSDDYDEERYIPGDELIDLLEAQTPRKTNGFTFAAGIMLILIGVGMLLAPGAAFFISYGWMLKNAEPSDGMITYTRICGGVFILIGIFVLFI